MDTTYTEAQSEVKEILIDEIAKARALKQQAEDNKSKDNSDEKRKPRRKREGFKRKREGLSINIFCEHIEVQEINITQKE